MQKVAIACIVLICGLGDKCQPKPEVGKKLEIVSAPSGATVKVDGVEKGETPLTLTDLGVEVDRVLCVGGGARNELWNRIKANVLRVPLTLSDEPEAGLKGAALLAAAGAGLIDNPAATACERRPAGKVVQPQPDSVPRYQAALAEFIRIYDHMLGFWQGR